MEGHAQLFVTLRAMGLLDKHHRAVFDAIHRAKLELRKEPTLLDWVAKQGIDRAKARRIVAGPVQFLDEDAPR